MKYTKRVEPYAPYDHVWNKVAAEDAYALLHSVGCDVMQSQHTQMTPYRLAYYLGHWFRPDDNVRFTTFDNVDPVVDQMVVVDPIDFWACCSHHMLPFFGKIYFGYIPKETLVGLSMVPLFVRSFCARPWLQETMLQGLADVFCEKLDPVGLGLVCKAMHTCQMLDLGGPPIPEMTFSVLRGAFDESVATRDEFMRLAGL